MDRFSSHYFFWPRPCCFYNLTKQLNWFTDFWMLCIYCSLTMWIKVIKWFGLLYFCPISLAVTYFFLSDRYQNDCQTSCFQQPLTGDSKYGLVCLLFFFPFVLYFFWLSTVLRPQCCNALGMTRWRAAITDKLLIPARPPVSPHPPFSVIEKLLHASNASWHPLRNPGLYTLWHESFAGRPLILRIGDNVFWNLQEFSCWVLLNFASFQWVVFNWNCIFVQQMINETTLCYNYNTCNSYSTTWLSLELYITGTLYSIHVLCRQDSTFDVY